MNKDALDLLLHCCEELGFRLTKPELEKFNLFAEELKKWNRKINLTSIHGDRDIVVKHFADSLTLLGITENSGTLLDIGSGGGFPSIPLKIMLPMLSVISVDAVEKKVLFQRNAARLLQLQNFTSLHMRGEELGKKYATSFDWIVSRAFSNLAYFADLTLPLVKETGKIIAMKGKDGKKEAKEEEELLAKMGIRISKYIHVKLPVTREDRYLIVMKKLKR